jgi:glycosyltransferase involved in cell wall biosynthesis
LRKHLPQPAKNFIKLVLYKYPHLFNPFYILFAIKYGGELQRILDENKDKKVIVMPPTIDWNVQLFQRPQQLALAFAKNGYLVFYGTKNLTYDKVKGIEKIADNLYLTNYPLILRNIAGSMIYISWPYNRFFADKFTKSRLVYDYIDELDVFDTKGKSKEAIYADFKHLIDMSEVVSSTADTLYEDVKKYNPKKLVLAPNGVDLAHFQNFKKTVPTDIKKIVETGKPIIGYYGALARWFDFKLVEKAAKERPNYEFILIGPLDYDKSVEKNKHLMKIKNLHFLGPKDYKDLPTYLHYFDVATIPFKVNKITESTSPVKLFEYMAGEKPTVTSEMRECHKYKSVMVAKDYDDYISKLDEALKISKTASFRKLVTKEAAENTWEARAKVITDALFKEE